MSRITCVWSLFCSIWFIKVCVFVNSFGKLVFCLSTLFCFLPILCRILSKLHRLHRHCLFSRIQVICAFVLTYLKQVAKIETRPKNLRTPLIKKMPLGSFWALSFKNAILKGKCGTFINWKSKNTSSKYKFC